MAALAVVVVAQFAQFLDIYRTRGPARLVLFDAGVEPLLARPLASGEPIYVDFDDRGAQAQARWRAAVAGVPQDRIVILPDGGVPPPGSLVFLRFQDCDYACEEVASGRTTASCARPGDALPRAPGRPRRRPRRRGFPALDLAQQPARLLPRRGRDRPPTPTIATEGRDEHGARFPLYFSSFLDYKSPLFVYGLAGVFVVTGPIARSHAGSRRSASSPRFCSSAGSRTGGRRAPPSRSRQSSSPERPRGSSSSAGSPSRSPWSRCSSCSHYSPSSGRAGSIAGRRRPRSRCTGSRRDHVRVRGRPASRPRCSRSPSRSWLRDAGGGSSPAGSRSRLTQVPCSLYTRVHPGALSRRYDATTFVTDDMPPGRSPGERRRELPAGPPALALRRLGRRQAVRAHARRERAPRRLGRALDRGHRADRVATSARCLLAVRRGGAPRLADSRRRDGRSLPRASSCSARRDARGRRDPASTR